MAEMRIRSSEAAIAALATLQSATDHSEPDIPSIDVSDDTLRNMPREIGDYYRRAIKGQLPPNEDVAAYATVQSLAEHLARVGARQGLKLPTRASLGTIRSAALNAHVVPLDESQDDYLLVFSIGLIRMIRLFSRYLARSWAYRESEYEGSSEVLLAEFSLLDAIVAFVTSQTVKVYRNEAGSIEMAWFEPAQIFETPAINLDADTALVADLLENSMLAFIVAHELAHLATIRERRLSERASDEFEDELRCDAIACRLSVEAMSEAVSKEVKGAWLTHVLAGPGAFLSCLRLVEMVSHASKHGTTPLAISEFNEEDPRKNRVGAYPAAVVRRVLVQGLLRTELDVSGVSEGVNLFAMAEWAERVCDAYWKFYSERHVKQHSESLRHEKLRSEFRAAGVSSEKLAELGYRLITLEEAEEIVASWEERASIRAHSDDDPDHER